ncbi:MAPEG family protein [Tumidithrix elongata RA019]|uniref:MAPEG family protein n=1 Tax=Tumidithrix elongata BACA0141 TaxID=2716417 RepID=A0AAW9PTH3_9CYAN|nr:MAPEG family protein [Tumidithrix elongata RA019]
MDLSLFALPSLVTLLAVVLYYGLGIGVGIARAKYKVPAPQITGDENFERTFRVHQNTLEQLAIFLPVLWLFSFYISPIWGAAIGGIWILGRIVYAWGYYAAAEKRSLGFAISSLATLALIIGSGIGIVSKILFR